MAGQAVPRGDSLLGEYLLKWGLCGNKGIEYC